MPASVKFGGPMGAPRAQLARTVREQQRAGRVRMLREWHGIASEAESVFADNVTSRVCALVARDIAASPDADASAAEAREAGFNVEFVDNVIRVSLSQ